MRRRLAAAFLRGDWTEVEELPRRPNRSVYAGIAVVVVAMVAVGVRSFLAGVPPQDWDDDGRLVVDEETSARYLSVDGTLRPVPNRTSAQLYSGADVTVTTVGHRFVVQAPSGEPIGYPEAPLSPPTLLGEDQQWTACATDGDALTLAVSGRPLQQPRAGTADGLVVQVGGSDERYLLDDERAYLIGSDAVLNALGYTVEQIRQVPREWLDLVPRGQTLRRLDLPRPQEGERTPTPLGRIGQVLVDDETDRRFVVDPDGLRPFVNETSALLAVGRRAQPRTVPHAAILQAPAGRPFGEPDLPDEPPLVPAGDAEAFPCVTEGADSIRVARGLDTDGLRRTLPPVSASRRTQVTTYLPADTGSLGRSAPPGRRIDEDHPASLVADGAAYALPGESAVSALGYDSGQVHRLGEPWLALLPRGPVLEPLDGDAGQG